MTASLGFDYLATLLHEDIVHIQSRSCGAETQNDDDALFNGKLSAELPTEMQDRASRRIMRRLNGQLQSYEERPGWAKEERAARMDAALRIALESLHPGLCDIVDSSSDSAPLCASIVKMICRM